MANCVVDLDNPRFGGQTFDPELDGERLGRQLRRVWWLMKDGHWRTLCGIAAVFEYPEASVSARLRDLRKQGVTVERRRVAGRVGLWEYRVVNQA